MSGVYFEQVTQNIPRFSAGKVEVAVTGQVNRRCLVGAGAVGDQQPVAVVQRVANLYGQVAGITFFFVIGEISQFDSGPSASNDRLGFPDNFVKTDIATVQMIWVVVRRQ